MSDLYIFRTLSRVDSLIQRANFRFGSLRFEVVWHRLFTPFGMILGKKRAMELVGSIAFNLIFYLHITNS